MATRDLGTLEQVPVREIWPHEENNFTPWLADNLHLLGQILELKLELLQVEAEMPDAGRVDILAKDMDQRHYCRDREPAGIFRRRPLR